MTHPRRAHPGPPPDPGLSQDQLRAWLNASGRTYVVLRSSDVVAALDWPAGVEKFRHILGAYQAYRQRSQVELPCPGTSGERCTEDVACSCGGSGKYLRAKSDRLERDELEEARAQIDRDLAALDARDAAGPR